MATQVVAAVIFVVFIAASSALSGYHAGWMTGFSHVWDSHGDEERAADCRRKAMRACIEWLVYVLTFGAFAVWVFYHVGAA